MNKNILKVKNFGKNVSLFNGGFSAPHFRDSKWKIGFYDEILKQIDLILKEFLIYKNYFKYLPIKFHFNKLLSKSDRFTKVFVGKNKEKKQIDSKYIFNEKMELKNEIEITYLLDEEALINSKDMISNFVDFIKSNASEVNNIADILLQKQKSVTKIDKEINNILDSETLRYGSKMCKTSVKEIVIDLMYLETFTLFNENIMLDKNIDENYIRLNTLISFDELNSILNQKNININKNSVISKENLIFNMDSENINKINKEFPFLINVSTSDKLPLKNKKPSNEYAQKEIITDENVKQYIEKNLSSKSKELVGVIDSWCSLSPSWNKIININNLDLPSGSTPNYSHGTQISSLIAANDLINDNVFSDGLGLIKVRHFGIIPMGSINMTSFLKKIEEIIENNQDLKIWNLSIEIEETPKNRNPRVSEFGKQLDRIQKKWRILFIISSGNNNVISYGADSLLAVSVGALYLENGLFKMATYGAMAKIFNLYDKPNIFDIGNDIKMENNENKTLWVVDDKDGYIGKWEDGTSYAAPLITRQCAYLMQNYPNITISEIKAIINIEAALVQKPPESIERLNFNADNKIVIFGSGNIVPGRKEVDTLKVPFSKGTNQNVKYRNFLMASSVSYFSNTNPNVGDEYSSTEVNIKLIARVNSGLEENKPKNLLVKKAVKNKDLTNVQQTQIDLISHFKKYNPNKVLIDEQISIIENLRSGIDKKTIPLHLTSDNDEVEIILECSDLFSNSGEVEYGFVIYLYELENGVLNEFGIINNHLLEEVYVNNQIREKSKVKS